MVLVHLMLQLKLVSVESNTPMNFNESINDVIDKYVWFVVFDKLKLVLVRRMSK